MWNKIKCFGQTPVREASSCHQGLHRGSFVKRFELLLTVSIDITRTLIGVPMWLNVHNTTF